MRLQLKQWTTAAHDQPEAQMSRLVLTKPVDCGGPAVVITKSCESGTTHIERPIPCERQADAPLRFALAGVEATFMTSAKAVENSDSTQRVI